MLDEATLSLDSESEALIQQVHDRLMAGRTSIVIVQHLLVRILDRIILFDSWDWPEGRAHEELVQRKGGNYRPSFVRQALGLVVAG